MSGNSISAAGGAALLAATLQLKLISSITKAMNVVNAEALAEGNAKEFLPDRCDFQSNCCTPDIKFAQRQVIRPEPRYLPRPIIHPTPRFEPIPLPFCSEKECKTQIAPGLPPPWKTLPLQPSVPTHPKIKIINRQPDMNHRGMLIDLFC